MSAWLIALGGFCCLYTAFELGHLLGKSAERVAPRAFDVRTGEPIAIHFTAPRRR